VLRHRKRKEAGVLEHAQVFDHAGVLIDEPPGMAGLPFVESSDNCKLMSASQQVLIPCLLRDHVRHIKRRDTQNAR
jgi:hypothetical protein